jgi:hypothetical protein
MCDPSIMGIASMATGLADSFGQQSAQKRQDEEYRKWMAQQDKNREEENANQEALRKQAELARAQSVNQLSGSSQKAQQAKEQGRLTSDLISSNKLTSDFASPDASSGLQPVADATLLSPGAAAGSTASTADTGKAADYLLSSQKSAANDPNFMSDLAGKLSAAAKTATSRIGDMATMASYGNSFGGLDQFSNQALLASGMTIDEINNLRNGAMKVYGVKQAVDPKQVVYHHGFML